jgi:hypothetical protein
VEGVVLQAHENVILQYGDFLVLALPFVKRISVFYPLGDANAPG